jgi:hypothetical protein
MPDVLLVYDIIAVEDVSTFVSGNGHRDFFGNTGTGHIAYRRPAKIVKHPAGHSCFAACAMPGIAEVSHMGTVPVKDPGDRVYPFGSLRVNDFCDHAHHSEYPALLSFLRLRVEAESHLLARPAIPVF